MEARALVKFQSIDTDGKLNVYIVIYFKYDGHPEGVAKDLIQFIKSKKWSMINGYNDQYKQFNGFGCFLAQYIAGFKDGMYIRPPDTLMDEEYNYFLTYDERVEKFTIGMNQSDCFDIDEFMSLHTKNYCGDNNNQDDNDNNTIDNDDNNSEYSDCSNRSESCGRNNANYKYWRS